MLAIAINKNGEIDKVKIVQRLDPDLDKAAVDAVMRWRFAPAEKDVSNHDETTVTDQETPF